MKQIQFDTFSFWDFVLSPVSGTHYDVSFSVIIYKKRKLSRVLTSNVAKINICLLWCVLFLPQWFGDAEKLTKALFSLAKKLSPAVIFVDEV